MCEYLVRVIAVVHRPRGLEVFEHSLFETLGQVVDTDEVLEVFGAGVVLGPARVHSLDDGCHVTKHQGMHQSWGETEGGGAARKVERVRRKERGRGEKRGMGVNRKKQENVVLIVHLLSECCLNIIYTETYYRLYRVVQLAQAGEYYLFASPLPTWGNSSNPISPTKPPRLTYAPLSIWIGALCICFHLTLVTHRGEIGGVCVRLSVHVGMYTHMCVCVFGCIHQYVCVCERER